MSEYLQDVNDDDCNDDWPYCIITSADNHMYRDVVVYHVYPRSKWTWIVKEIWTLEFGNWLRSTI